MRREPILFLNDKCCNPIVVPVPGSKATNNNSRSGPGSRAPIGSNLLTRPTPPPTIILSTRKSSTHIKKDINGNTDHHNKTMDKSSMLRGSDIFLGGGGLYYPHGGGSGTHCKPPLPPPSNWLCLAPPHPHPHPPPAPPPPPLAEVYTANPHHSIAPRHCLCPAYPQPARVVVRPCEQSDNCHSMSNSSSYYLGSSALMCNSNNSGRRTVMSSGGFNGVCGELDYLDTRQKTFSTSSCSSSSPSPSSPFSSTSSYEDVHTSSPSPPIITITGSNRYRTQSSVSEDTANCEAPEDQQVQIEEEAAEEDDLEEIIPLAQLAIRAQGVPLMRSETRSSSTMLDSMSSRYHHHHHHHLQQQHPGHGRAAGSVGGGGSAAVVQFGGGGKSWSTIQQEGCASNSSSSMKKSVTGTAATSTSAAAACCSSLANPVVVGSPKSRSAAIATSHGIPGDGTISSKNSKKATEKMMDQNMLRGSDIFLGSGGPLVYYPQQHHHPPHHGHPQTPPGPAWICHHHHPPPPEPVYCNNHHHRLYTTYSARDIQQQQQQQMHLHQQQKQLHQHRQQQQQLLQQQQQAVRRCNSDTASICSSRESCSPDNARSSLSCLEPCLDLLYPGTNNSATSLVLSSCSTASSSSSRLSATSSISSSSSVTSSGSSSSSSRMSSDSTSITSSEGDYSSGGGCGGNGIGGGGNTGGSSNSDKNSCSLPRVIKPRKRRKKDKNKSVVVSSSSSVTGKDNSPCELIASTNCTDLINNCGNHRHQHHHSYNNKQHNQFKCENDDHNNNSNNSSNKSILVQDQVHREQPEEEEKWSSNGRSESMMMFNRSIPRVTTSRPPSRPWLTLGHPDGSRPTSIFTVMCYNVLCDKYATRQLYGYCPNWALSWDYRRKAILDEIRNYGADIISLQEVETEQFYNFFLPELQREGYDGIFSPKSRAKTMSENDRKHVDGCAILYRTNKFSLIKEHLVEFNQLAMANAEGSDDMLNRVMTKDNIGLAALLQTKEGAFQSGMIQDPSQAVHPLLVCTAHIHWDPEYCDVKLIQTMMLMHELRQIVEDSATSFRPGAQKADANNMPLILCGDLNSLPDSGVVEFLKAGRISAEHGDFKDLGYKDCLRKLSSCMDTNKNEYNHPFKINKAYSDDIMPFTNYTFDFKGVIDYIFYSKQHMSVLGLLGPLDPEWLKENKVAGCPHPHVPSDHFPLLVEFEMSPPNLSVQQNQQQQQQQQQSSQPQQQQHLSNGLVLRR